MEKFNQKMPLDQLRKNYWNISPREDLQPIILPAPIKNIIDALPEIYIDFLKKFKLFENPSGQFWFLMLEDYEGTSDSEFLWNEFEKQSLDAALDKSDFDKISGFWQNHIPIAISVKNGYAYLAIKICDIDAGAIVCGNEPEYEEVVTISPSLASLFEMLVDHVTGKITNPQLNKIL